MLSFILLLLFFFVLWPLIKIGWRIWSQMRQMRRFMADPEGEMRRQSENARKKSYSSNPFSSFTGSGRTQKQSRRRGKKIPRDVGEYISFTEVEISAEERRAYEQQQSGTKFKTEEQITDIKWVDIQ